jgi:hypothetical protein
MLYLIEGARNSGKTYVTSQFSIAPVYKFPFTELFTDLEYDDKSVRTHDFALGKEIMLLDLNRKGFIENMICDRSIYTVLAWGVLSGRITEKEAEKQLDLIIHKGLLDNTTLIWVKGQNPFTGRSKDFWDFRDNEKEKEELLYSSLFKRTKQLKPDIKLEIIDNTFDDTVKEKIKYLQDVWNTTKPE